MRILFINPQTPYHREGLIHPPLGLGYLSTVLKQYGHEVNCVDMPVLDFYIADLVREVEAYRPQLIGITSGTFIFADACEAAVACKEVVPEVPVVMGGPHVTFLPEQTLLRHGEIDFVLIYEAEFSLLALVDALERNQSYENIPGLAYRLAPDRVQVNLPDPPLDRDLFSIPDRSIFPMRDYLRNDIETTLITAWSCPSRCVFCATTRMGRTLRYRATENIITEMKQLRAMGFRSLFISDDNFTFDKNRVYDICDAMLAENIDLVWTCNMRATDSDLKLLTRMKEAGCYRVFSGFESFSREALRVIRKGSTPDAYLRHMDNLERAGLELHASFIIGNPGETEEAILTSLKTIKQLGPRVVTFNNIIAFPGTPIFDRPEEYGLDIPDPYWYEKKDWLQMAPIGTTILPPAKVQELLVRCHREYYTG